MDDTKRVSRGPAPAEFCRDFLAGHSRDQSFWPLHEARLKVCRHFIDRPDITEQRFLVALRNRIAQRRRDAVEDACHELLQAWYAQRFASSSRNAGA